LKSGSTENSKSNFLSWIALKSLTRVTSARWALLDGFDGCILSFLLSFLVVLQYHHPPRLLLRRLVLVLILCEFRNVSGTGIR
jgi:hypothetical protein